MYIRVGITLVSAVSKFNISPHSQCLTSKRCLNLPFTHNEQDTHQCSTKGHALFCYQCVLTYACQSWDVRYSWHHHTLSWRRWHYHTCKASTFRDTLAILCVLVCMCLCMSSWLYTVYTVCSKHRTPCVKYGWYISGKLNHCKQEHTSLVGFSNKITL